MATKSTKVDLYISKSTDFAKPILIHFRKLVHSACPEVEEKIKWGFPHFDYKGMMCSMAAFKQHCAITFWKAQVMKDKILMANAASESAMGHFGKITSLKDLPSDKKIIGYIKEAMKLNDEGINLPAKNKSDSNKKAVKVPNDFSLMLKKNKIAYKAFDNFSLSHKREYVEWITEAKTEATRNKRMTTAIEWLSEGKPRNWKYMKS
jgi:uncharacterized protein YdeI (YjbR/CyaY-like superfamily)